MAWSTTPILITTLLVIFSATNFAQDTFVQNHLNFATNFYSNLINKNAGKSIIYSPFSLQSCFSMLHMGTKGPAATELERGFNLGSSDRQVISNNFKQILDKYRDSTQMRTFNKVYVDHNAELVPQFKEIATQNFYSEAETADLTKGSESAAIVNNWIKEKTNGKIEKLIESEDCNADTRLILLNAIYFKGSWQHRFDKALTQKQKFWLSQDNSADIDMMHIEEEFTIKKLSDPKMTVVELPYADSDLSMVLLIPMEREGLSNVETKLKDMNLQDLWSNGGIKRRIHLYMPKFKVETSIQLREILEGMGVEEIFSNPDLSDLAKSDKALRVVKAIHKAVVEVNEEGTEAAAATGAAVATRAGSLPVRADRPFLFIIKDNAGRTFFMGRFLGNAE